jgi:hypothetical protein
MPMEAARCLAARSPARNSAAHALGWPHVLAVSVLQPATSASARSAPFQGARCRRPRRAAHRRRCSAFFRLILGQRALFAWIASNARRMHSLGRGRPGAGRRHRPHAAVGRTRRVFSWLTHLGDRRIAGAGVRAWSAVVSVAPCAPCRAGAGLGAGARRHRAAEPRAQTASSSGRGRCTTTAWRSRRATASRAATARARS